MGFKSVYKVFLRDNGELKNLFRGLPQEQKKRNTRTIKADKVLQAEPKWARDGGDSRRYWTGIHCLPSKEDAVEYLDNFMTDRDRVVVPCYAKHLRRKPTNDSVILADKLYVPKESKELILSTDRKVIDKSEITLDKTASM